MSNCLDSTIIQFSGPDVRQVLQGQTTRNFATASVGTPLMGAFCDLKGRVLTDFLALITDDSQVLMRVHSSVADKLLEHLKKYLMFSKTDALATKLAVRGFVFAPNPNNDGTIANLPSSVDRGDGLLESWTNDLNEVPEIAQPLSEDQWRCELIDIGDAQIVAATWGRYLPQDLNYDRRGLIDFDKGCYTGQEIVARLHYRGTPKRRLAKLKFSSEITSELGCSIQDRATGRGVGSIVQLATHDDKVQALAELTVNGPLDALVVGADGHVPSSIDWI